MIKSEYTYQNIFNTAIQYNIVFRHDHNNL